MTQEEKNLLLQDLCARLPYGVFVEDGRNKDAMDYAFPIDLADYKDFAKHFFELGLKSQKGE